MNTVKQSISSIQNIAEYLGLETLKKDESNEIKVNDNSALLNQVCFRLHKLDFKHVICTMHMTEHVKITNNFSQFIYYERLKSLELKNFDDPANGHCYIKLLEVNDFIVTFKTFNNAVSLSFGFPDQKIGIQLALYS